MKRYWFMLLLAPLIAAGVSSYYIQAAINRHPEFILQRQSGDEQAVKGVRLEGDYGRNEIRKSISITPEGSTVKQGQTLYERLAFNSVDRLEKLVEQYPGFMRGKRNLNELYEDSDKVVYGGIKEDKTAGGFRFIVQEFGKQDHEVTGLQAPVPNSKVYQQMYVNDVEPAGGQLIVSAVAYHNGVMEPHVYSIDLLGKQEPREAAWADVPRPAPNEEASLTSTGASLQPSRYIAFVSMLHQRTQEEYGRGIERQGKGQLLVYDVQEGRAVRMDSKDITGFLTMGTRENLQQLEVDGDTLYLLKSTEDGLKSLQYRIPEGTAAMKTIPVSTADSLFQLKGHVLYTFNRFGKGADLRKQTLTVTDLQTGSSMYEGTIEARSSDRQSLQALDSLSLHSILLE